MKFEEFNDLWVAAFGSQLTARNGAASWAEFVEDDRGSDGLLVRVLNEFANEYTAMTRAMSPHAKNAIPTLKAYKDRYFEHINARKAANAQPSNCAMCGGFGRVYALAPCKGDAGRQLAPEDWRTVSRDRVYPFAEAYDCPTCKRDAYKSDALLQRVAEHCLPEVVAANDPRNAYGVPMGGDAIIREDLRRRLGAPAAVKVDLNDDTLERDFPMEVAK